MVFKSSLNNGGGGGSGTIQQITSSGNTITVTNPTGPVTNLEAVAGGGNVSTTGSPALGNIAIFSGATTITNGNLTGDITTSGSPTATLATVNASVGTYGSVNSAPVIIVNAKGLITGVSTVSLGTGSVTTTGSPALGNLAIFSGGTSITNGNLSGDVTTSGSPTVTLATVNANIGSYGSINSIPIVTVNAKGLITGVSTASVSVLTSGLPTNQINREISFSLDGQGSGITGSGTWYLAQIPYSGSISSWSLVADRSGSINIDIWKKNQAVPTVSSTIASSFLPGLTATQAVFSQTVPGWNATVTAGDCFAFNVNAAATLTKVSLTLQITAS